MFSPDRDRVKSGPFGFCKKKGISMRNFIKIMAKQSIDQNGKISTVDLAYQFPAVFSEILFTGPIKEFQTIHDCMKFVDDWLLERLLLYNK